MCRVGGISETCTEGVLGRRRAGDDWVASDAHEFLLKLVQRFPQYYARPLWLTGESYAGHYVPLLAAKILEYPQPALNLQGYAIGPSPIANHIRVAILPRVFRRGFPLLVPSPFHPA